ncbi:hypothetical protein NVV94_03430 [Pseudomonas sp. LS1212]|uniref:hypothetical protein n=1 Tax=Pseudomonas sp. LS1212 TaxID=2972478 RepID=UPI00215D5B91|nr:hypothetical protein [Pseudomonas sp. LS1212]UVJ44669.1 hypothetical protein NVV94_03430 [Pseudomonas sp. LS1212]
MRAPLLIALPLLGVLSACSEPHDPVPLASESNAPALIGAAATAHPLTGAIPANPYMAANGSSYMHADGYSSDSHPGPGPLGREMQVNSRDGSRKPGGMCPIHTFDSQGRLVVLCANLMQFELQLLEPRTLKLLARYPLPPRPSTFHALITLDPDKIMADTSGAYFYVDEQDRVVIADAEQHIQRIAHRQDSTGRWVFEEVDSWDLSDKVPHDCARPTAWFPKGECDPITGVMPDHQGLIWWITRRGRIGTLNPHTGQVQGSQLVGEEIQNGLSVAADGVYLVSDHAMYRFAADADGKPVQGWREAYDRGTARKVGAINQGSGTTPTLLGSRYVTITDNSDERINLLVYRREQNFAGDRLICKIPVFGKGASATDNSAIGWGRSIILENNHGYTSAFAQKDWQAVSGGISRVDIREDESGCDLVWQSAERSPSVVPKLSVANGLVYFYTYEPQPEGENAWYLMALDFESGKTQFKALSGVGQAFDNNWSPITLAPDGTAYVGTFGGLVALWDKGANAASEQPRLTEK